MINFKELKKGDTVYTVKISVEDLEINDNLYFTKEPTLDEIGKEFVDSYELVGYEIKENKLYVIDDNPGWTVIDGEVCPIDLNARNVCEVSLEISSDIYEAIGVGVTEFALNENEAEVTEGIWYSSELKCGDDKIVIETHNRKPVCTEIIEKFKRCMGPLEVKIINNEIFIKGEKVIQISQSTGKLVRGSDFI